MGLSDYEFMHVKDSVSVLVKDRSYSLVTLLWSLRLTGGGEMGSCSSSGAERFEAPILEFVQFDIRRTINDTSRNVQSARGRHVLRIVYLSTRCSASSAAQELARHGKNASPTRSQFIRQAGVP